MLIFDAILHRKYNHPMGPYPSMQTLLKRKKWEGEDVFFKNNSHIYLTSSGVLYCAQVKKENSAS